MSLAEAYTQAACIGLIVGLGGAIPPIVGTLWLEWSEKKRLKQKYNSVPRLNIKKYVETEEDPPHPVFGKPYLPPGF